MFQVQDTAFAAAATAPVGRRPSTHLPTSVRRPLHLSAKRGRIPLVTLPATSDTPEPVAAPLAAQPTDIWELDFYSRPVVGADGKKLWELIVTDSSGVLEHIEAIPNSMVNSRELRKRFEDLLGSERVKPRVVRFFRSQMLNMILIALDGIEGLTLRPSRRTYMLFNVLEDREKNVYPKMPGFRPSMRVDNTLINISVPERMPDALMGEKYAFAEMQLNQFGDLSEENIGFGELCPVDPELSPETVVPGLVVFSRRAKAISGWITGIELATVKADLAKREIVIECGLDKEYLFAKLNDNQRREAKKFLDAKDALNGLHFLAIQQSDGDEDIAGFWLLRDVKI